MAAPRPLPPTPPGLLDDEDPGKWDRVKQALWETNLNAPIRGIYNMMNADPYTLYTDTGAAGQQAVADSFDAAGGITVGSAMVPKPSNALMMGIKAYHGSPHSFDKFSMDKIGTGEGAQAYGHGLYFAEKEGIAKSYRDALTPKDYSLNAPEAEVSARHGQDIVDTFVDHGGDRNELQATIVRLKNQNNRDLMELGVSDASQINPPNDWGIEANVIRRSDRIKRLEGLLSSDDVKINPGSMYEVNIDADPNAFLDWDKPLSEQPEAVRVALGLDKLPGPPTDEEVQAVFALASERGVFPADMPEYKALEARLDNYKSDAWKQMGIAPPYRGDVHVKADAITGGEYVHGLEKGELGPMGLTGSTPNASRILKEKGIPGIKYLDAGSRFTPANLPNNPIANEARQFLSSANGDADKALQMFRDSNPIERWASTERDEITKVIKAAAVPATRNYVVFDDSLIDIIKKYGIAGLLGAGGMYGMSADEAQAGAR